MSDPVAALTAVLPEERDTPAQLVPPKRPERRRGTPPPDTTCALAGAAAALGVLGLTSAMVQTVTRQRRRPG